MIPLDTDLYHSQNLNTLGIPMQAPVRSLLRVIGCIVCIMLWGCGQALPTQPAFDLAQACVSIHDPHKSIGIAVDNAWHYRTRGFQDPGLARFYVKPTGLGTFLLYDHEGGYLAYQNGVLERQWHASATAEWRIEVLDLKAYGEGLPELHLLTTSLNQHRLGLNGAKFQLSGSLTSTEAAMQQVLALERHDPASCRPFPEADLAARTLSSPGLPLDENEPVVGFVDYHTHIAFPKALGGAAMPGGAFHPYGIEHALGECSGLHGARGELDILEGQTGGGSGHAVDGYPKFTYWPHRKTKTHIQAYYRWIERAYLSGLRLMVTHATGNPTFCQILKLMHPKQSAGDCKSDDDLAMQTDYVFDLRDYIDAQSGGPGQGFLQIAQTSDEARAIIRKGKLAVVLGSEYGTLFDCVEGAKFCTPEYIDRKVEELYQRGIRSVFPIHRFDNAFGGTMPQAGSNGAWMHLSSKISTGRIEHLFDLINPRKLLFKSIRGHYWELEKCPAGVPGTKNVRSMQAFIEEDFNFLVKAAKSVPVVGGVLGKLLGWIFIDKLKPLPTYDEFSPDDALCNKRPLQDLGHYLIRRLASKGIIIEIDHLSYVSLKAALETLEKLAYPGFVSSHGWIENMPEIRRRVFQLGGQMAVTSGRPRDVAVALQTYAQERAAFEDFTGIGLGTDIQGIASQAASDEELSISYPFRSVDGTVEFLPPITGERYFNYDQEGMAHYGLLPEWLEELRMLDEQTGSRNIPVLMNSAEAYLRMWKRAELRATELRLSNLSG